MPNLVEYALGLDPLARDADPLPLTLGVVEGQSYLRLALTLNPAATDVVTIVETTPSPAIADSWSTSGLTSEINTPETLQVRTNLPLSALPSQFLRIKATR